jgi:solute carrier family 7 (cationic amino acid transporter), member 2
MALKDFFHSLNRKKKVDLASTKLNKFMGTFDLTAIGVGSTLGLGVYVLSGQVAKTLAGPSVIVSFAIAAFASVLAGFCFAEFGARVPKAGSAYTYTYVTIGEFVAFLVGWNLVLEYAIGSAAQAKGISDHFDVLVGGAMSEFWMSLVPIDIPYMGRYVDFFAFTIVMVISSMSKQFCHDQIVQCD